MGTCISKEKLALQVETIKDPLERVQTLEAKLNPSFVKSRAKPSTIGSYQPETKAPQEEKTIDQLLGRLARINTYNWSSVVEK